MKTTKGRQGTRHRLIYNNDSSYFWYFEPSMGVEAFVHELVGRLRGTRIDTLVVRIDRGNLVPFYDSRIEGKVGKGQAVFGETVWWRHVACLRRLFDQGIDPWEVVFQRAREAGLAAFAGIRMNDLHHTKPKRKGVGFDVFVSDIAKDPRYFIGEDCQPPGPDLPGCRPGDVPDFMHEEVREHRFQIVKELCERYDLDGLELDFQRHCFFFRHSQIKEGLPRMTALLRRVREMLDACERQRGHPICLLVRIPSWLERCVEIGLDVPAWVREGLVDMLGVSAQADTEFDAPIEPFVRLAEGTPCEVLGTFEYVMPSPYRYYLPEMARAGAASYYHQGADGIYLFNSQFFYQPYADHSDGDIHVLRPVQHRTLYNELHDPEALRFRSKRYLISRPTTRPWPRFPKQLPVSLSRQAPGRSHRIVVKMADDTGLGQRLGLLEGVQLSLRVGGLTEEDALAVTFNGHAIPQEHRQAFHGTPGFSQSGLSHVLKYALLPEWVRTGENLVEIALAGANAMVLEGIKLVDVEVSVNYRNVPII